MPGLGSPIEHREFVGVGLLEHRARSEWVMIGQSVAWREVLKSGTRVAPLETTICLQGESGTGKEVLARFIHRNSSRRHGPFVAINCAALPEQLLESELFGFERGAFTSAHQAKAGQFELAAGGVLFLDEIAELTPPAQAKILRVLAARGASPAAFGRRCIPPGCVAPPSNIPDILGRRALPTGRIAALDATPDLHHGLLEEREFRRLGGTKSLKANVRVIVATNRDLHNAVSRGAFREDLYYRVNVFEIRIPPLRERREDIPLFARRFLDEFGRMNGLRAIDLTPEAAEALLAHTWPGNVRELRNVIERATIVCDGGVIRDSDLALVPSCATPSDITDLGHLEQRAIERVIREAGGNRSRAARQLGISRTQLYGRLRKYGFEGVGRPHDSP